MMHPRSVAPDAIMARQDISDDQKAALLWYAVQAWRYDDSARMVKAMSYYERLTGRPTCYG